MPEKIKIKQREIDEIYDIEDDKVEETVEKQTKGEKDNKSEFETYTEAYDEAEEVENG